MVSSILVYSSLKLIYYTNSTCIHNHLTYAVYVIKTLLKLVVKLNNYQLLLGSSIVNVFVDFVNENVLKL